MNISLISIKTQFENLGDALILRELIKIASTRSRIAVDCQGVPRNFLDSLDLPPDAIKLRKELDAFSLMITKALSGHVVHYFFLPGGVFGEISGASFAKKTIRISAFALLWLVGVKFSQVGVSFENLGPRHRLYLRLRGLIMHRLFVRDSASAAHLAASGIKHSGQLPDLAFGLFEKHAKIKRETKRICFSFRTDQYETQFEECFLFAARILSLAPNAVSISVASQVSRDRAGMRSLAEKLQKLCDTNINVLCAESIDEARRNYGLSDVVVTNRLHVLMLAGSVNCVAVSYSESAATKVSGIISDLGRKELLLSSASSDEQILAALDSSPIEGTAQRSALKSGIEGIFAATRAGQT